VQLLTNHNILDMEVIGDHILYLGRSADVFPHPRRYAMWRLRYLSGP
jgi:hypothetical protein